MRRAIGLLTAIGLSLAVAGPTLAARPANQACLGHDVSGLAADGSGFGHFVADIAMNTRGAGEEVQALQAGQIPDEALPNTCND
jgi:hypothetical protein